MHRTLKQETAQPPAATLNRQQRRFNEFRSHFNTERPHEALDYKTPSQLYDRSARLYPIRLPDMSYDDGFLVRAINPSGDMSWHHQRVFITRVLSGERIGLIEIAEDRYRVFYGPLILGEFDSCDLSFYPRRFVDR